MCYLMNFYADTLQKNDVIELFEILEEECGSRLQAAEFCSLERKTVYDWKNVEEIKLTTKQKVVEAVLKVKPEKAYEFIISRLEQRTADVLFLLFVFLYDFLVVEEHSKQEFTERFTMFNEFKKKYGGLIHKLLEEETGDMSKVIRDKAQRIGVPIPLTSVEEMDSHEIIELIPEVIKEMKNEKYQHLDDRCIAQEFNLSVELIRALRVV